MPEFLFGIIGDFLKPGIIGFGMTSSCQRKLELCAYPN